jgi:hypothetical protein
LIELWFKRLAAKALMFRKLEAEVPKQARYEGGHSVNIVTYAMAKVFHAANDEEQVLDLDAIWRKQSVPEPMALVLMIAAAEAHDCIMHPPQGGRNMSEWAKQQACWNDLMSRKLAFDDDFEICLAPIDEAKTTARGARSEKVLTDGINAQAEIVSLGSDLLKTALKWGQDGKRLTTKELQILQICASMPSLMPTDYQSKHALTVLDGLGDQGFGLG